MRYLIAAGCFVLGSVAQGDNSDQLAREGLALLPPFQQHLMSTVKAAMQEGGAQGAVEACKSSASGIAAEHSQNGWRVGRTSLRVRNPENAPDAWERLILEQFAQRAAAGEPVETLQHQEIVAGEVRVMKAIVTGEPCLACHGKALAPELAALIDVQYPQDQARGFSQGELRGAFSLRHRLE